jgi:hypothetical protein
MILSGEREHSSTMQPDWRAVLNHVVHVAVCPLNSALALKLTFTGQFLTKSYFTPIPSVRYEDFTAATTHPPMTQIHAHLLDQHHHDSTTTTAATTTATATNSTPVKSSAQSATPVSCHVQDVATRQGTVRRLCAISFLFGRPPSHPYPFPLVDFDLSLLFSTLSIANIMTVYECVLGMLLTDSLFFFFFFLLYSFFCFLLT